MSLVEGRVEIPLESAAAADDVLVELQEEAWSVVEDIVVRRAWLVGIFADEQEAKARWEQLRPMLPAEARGEVVWRELREADWRDSYKARFSRVALWAAALGAGVGTGKLSGAGG